MSNIQKHENCVYCDKPVSYYSSSILNPSLTGNPKIQLGACREHEEKFKKESKVTTKYGDSDLEKAVKKLGHENNWFDES